MSRFHHNAYSQQPHHHAHQNSWFMSSNIVNSLFCSTGNSSGSSCNNAFINGSNINNHLTSLLNAQHFIPPNPLSSNQSHSNSSQTSMIGGNGFSSHYHTNHQNFTSQPYSSIFSLNNTYSSSANGSNNRFVAGQNNHHYQNSSNYSRSMHPNRSSRNSINYNSESNHSRRYQPNCNSNGHLLSFSVNNKSMNMNVDLNWFNDNSFRPLSSNQSFYQNKDSKSSNNNSGFQSNTKYTGFSKSSNHESESFSFTGKCRPISSSDSYQTNKAVFKNQFVRGMENIKLDNEGVASNYVQFTGIASKQTYETGKASSINIKDNPGKNSNHPKQDSINSSTKFPQYQLQNIDSMKSNSDISKSLNDKKIELPNSSKNPKKNSSKFLLNVDEDELMYYHNDVAEMTKYELENNETTISLIEEKNCNSECCSKSLTNFVDKPIIKKIEVNIENTNELANGSRYECVKKKKLINNFTSRSFNSLDSINSTNMSSGQTVCGSNADFVNSDVQFNSHHQPILSNSYSPSSTHFATGNLVPTAPPNMSVFTSQMVPNFPMNCPLLSSSGNNIMTAACIATALGSNHHPSMVPNPNSKCNLFRHDSITLNSSTYHDIVSGKLWQYYITNRQTEAMYVRKVQLRNALHMVMSYVFENAGLFIVGSSMNGFGNDHSDMDLCLTITSKELHQKKEAFVVLNQLVEPLRKCSFIKNLQLIRATVPILKFRDALAGVDCDLNINNVVGIYNTHLLAMYNRIDWRVRPLGMYIKHWAQKLDLHDASRGRLSTYTLILMIIQYLQIGCQPPVLPSLQMNFTKHFSYDRQVKEVDMRLELPWEELRSTNTNRLSDLLLGFFEYYVEKFDFARMAVSIRNGKPIPIEVAIKQLPPHEQLHNVKSFKMFIEEPFSLTNVARSLFDGLVFSRIKRCFRHSLQVMRMKKSLKYMFVLPTPCNSSTSNVASNSDNSDQNRSTISSSPSTSNSTQDENSKTIPVSDNIDNDVSEKSDLRDDVSCSDDNKSLDKNIIVSYDFEDDEIISINNT